MATLEIKKFNEPVLRKRCRKVREIDKEIKQLIVALAQTMEKNQGVGLAAPQVGVLKNIIVVKGNFKGQGILALVDPKIIRKSREKEKGIEGCLSFPGIYLEIKRAKEVEIKALNINGERIKLKTAGLSARVLQHEIDHLNGILFFDRLSFFKRIKFTLLNAAKRQFR